jgi:hypothetical protein
MMWIVNSHWKRLWSVSDMFEMRYKIVHRELSIGKELIATSVWCL